MLCVILKLNVMLNMSRKLCSQLKTDQSERDFSLKVFDVIICIDVCAKIC